MPLRSRQRTKASACRFDSADGPQVACAHGVDTERRGGQRLGEDASRAVRAGCDGVSAAYADPRREPPVERVADAVAERHVLGDAEDLARGAELEQADGFVFRESQSEQLLEVRGVGIERMQFDAVASFLHRRFCAAGGLRVGFGTDEDERGHEQTGQRQKHRDGPNFPFREEPRHILLRFTFRCARAPP